MALSTRELYLVLRAKNEASAALNSMGRDLDRARASAALMGAESTRAHLMAEQAAARNAKAHSEFVLRQLESQRATAQQAVANQQAAQQMLALNAATLEAQKSSQVHTMSVLQQKQAMDQNQVSLLQNAKAHNDVEIARLRSTQGAGQHVQALHQQNIALKDQIANTRDVIIARQNDINAQRDQINSTQQLINSNKEHQNVVRQNVAAAQDSARSYDDQIRAQRDLISQQRLDIANRQNLIASVNQEIGAIKQSNVEREVHNQKLRDSGRTMMDVGTMTAAGGAIALAGVVSLTQAAVDYEKQVAMTKTQVDDTSVTLKQLGDIGLEVARDFGVGFDQIQDSLFDIFSSIDVSVPQAEMLLRNFSKAAIAGGTDIKTAGQTTISVLNAWRLPIEDVTKVLDTQFRVVKEGRVSYEDLSTSVGRAIPSAVRAGQSFETLGGMLAYMTRNGQTAYNAVASAGRALDLISNSKVGDRLEAIGVKVRDAEGNFRPLADVVVDLQRKLEDLSPAERAKEIEELFKGSGNNIQARRFWDLVLASKAGADGFADMVSRMEKSGGDLEAKYSEMSDTIAVRNEKMKNNWKALGIELGTELFPAVEKLSDALLELAESFEKLSPGQKETLAWAMVMGPALAIVGGGFLVVAGAVATLAGALGIGVGAMMLIIGVILAFGAAWIYAYTQVEWFHDAVNWWFSHLWEVIKWFFNGWKETLSDFWQGLKNVGTSFGETFGTLKQGFTDFWNWFTEGWKANLDKTKQQVSDFSNWFTTGWSQTFSDAKNAPQEFWTWFTTGWTVNLNASKAQIQGFWSWFTSGWAATFASAKQAPQEFWSWFTSGWAANLSAARSQLQSFWSWFTSGWTSTLNSARSGLQGFFSWFTSGWTSTLSSARSGIQGFFSWFVSGWSSTLASARSALSSFWSWFTSGWTSVMNSARSAVSSGANAIASAISSLVNTIRSIFNGLIGSAFGIGANIVNGIRNGVMSAAGSLAAAAASVVSNALAAARAAVSIFSPSRDFAEKVGKPISEGMAKGVLDNAKMLDTAVTRVTRGSLTSASDLLKMAQSQAFNSLSRTPGMQQTTTGVDSSGLAPVGGYGGGRGGSPITINIYTNELDPRRHAMQLGLELEKAIG